MENRNFPCGERLEPLGAPREEGNEKLRISKSYVSFDRLRSIEEEQEFLNSSLFALTTHFAQVQLRLRQIVEAPSNEKEELLKSLEEFAFRGIPDVDHVNVNKNTLAQIVKARRSQQHELLRKLKKQMRLLERCAFKEHKSILMRDFMVERQRLILNELIKRMDLKLDQNTCYKCNKNQLKMQVSIALTPLCLKEQLLDQLKVQVADLEAFIDYLQKTQRKFTKSLNLSPKKKQPVNVTNIKNGVLQMINYAVAIVQMFAMLNLNCRKIYNKYPGEVKSKCLHWGNVRAKLEMAIAKVVELDKCKSPGVVLTAVVRKNLAVYLKELMEHGLKDSSTFMCCTTKKYETHAWHIILQYYHTKNGEKYNTTPLRKLSQSFDLNMEESSSKSENLSLLTTINNIIKIHAPYKRSNNCLFKAFICASLNAHKLSQWLSLIFQCQNLVRSLYEPWSYTCKTGFEDTLQSLKVLDTINFELPVDYSIEQFKNMHDLFS